MKRIINKKLWLFVLLIFVSLGCNLFNDIGNKLETVQGTAEGIATEAEEGKLVLQTGQAIVTKVADSEILMTVQAGATKIDESGIVETAKAFATKEAPGLKATIESLATQNGQSVVGTLESFATNEVPSLKQTAHAMSTQIPGFSGESPEDIPIMPGGETNIIANDNVIFYSVNSSIESVLEFYTLEMQKYGWQKNESETRIKQNMATLSYEKSSRKVTITVMSQNSEDKTAVFIFIQD